jgi:hypothetical protein
MQKIILILSCIIVSIICKSQDVKQIKILSTYKLGSFTFDNEIEGIIKLEGNEITYTSNGYLNTFDIETKSKTVLKKLAINEYNDEIVNSIDETYLRASLNSEKLKKKFRHLEYLSLQYSRSYGLSPNLDKFLLRDNKNPRTYHLIDTNGTTIHSFNLSNKDYPKEVIYCDTNTAYITESSGYRDFQSEPIGYYTHYLDLQNLKHCKIGPAKSLIKHIKFLDKNKIAICLDNGFVFNTKSGKPVGRLTVLDNSNIACIRNEAIFSQITQSPLSAINSNGSLLAILSSKNIIDVYRIPLNYFSNSLKLNTNEKAVVDNKMKYKLKDKEEFMKAIKYNNGNSLVKIIYKANPRSFVTAMQFIESAEIGNYLSRSSGYGKKLFSSIMPQRCYNDTCVINAEWYREGVLKDGDLFVQNSGFQAFVQNLKNHIQSFNGVFISCEYLGNYSDDERKIAEEKQAQLKSNVKTKNVDKETEYLEKLKKIKVTQEGQWEAVTLGMDNKRKKKITFSDGTTGYIFKQDHGGYKIENSGFTYWEYDSYQNCIDALYVYKKFGYNIKKGSQ